MEWLFIIVLAIWVWSQGRRISALTRRVAELEAIAAAALATRAPADAAAPPRAAPSAPATDEEPLLLTDVVPPDDDVLLLDTPLPEAVNDDEPIAAPAPPPVAARDEEPLVLTDPVAPAFPPPAPAATAPNRKLEQWLAENGLAWLAGGLLVLGAIYLVSFATQQGWFTPPVQLATAVTFGVALIGASEWARRESLAQPPGHPLVAALLAGAGVVAFYVTTWAAHGVYDFIDIGAAAALLTLCAALLIGLAFLHGEALGVLAIAAALLAPPLTHAPNWPPSGPMSYLCAVGIAGFAVATLKRWPWVAASAIAGLYFWFAASIGENAIGRALVMLSIACVGGVAVAVRPPLPGASTDAVSWSTTHKYLPAIGISVSAVLMLWTWLATANTASGSVAGPAWVGAMFVMLAAATVRARVAPAASLAVTIGALVFGFVAYLTTRFEGAPSDLYPFMLFAAVAIAASAIFAKPHHASRTLIAASGAIGAALLTILAAFTRDEWHSAAAWAPLFVSAALLTAVAWIAERDAANPAQDTVVDFWFGAAGVLVLLGIESAFPSTMRTAAHAGAAALFAGGLLLRPWRSLHGAALTAGALAIGHAFSADLIGGALSGSLPIWAALATLAASSALLCGAANLVARKQTPSATAEALTSAAVIVAIVATFLTLRWFAAGGAGSQLDAFAESALRVLALLGAGLVMLKPPQGSAGRIAQWRGHVLMGLGLAYAVLVFGLTANPWWGGPGFARVVGPPVLNTLLLGFAATSALAIAAAHRLYETQRIAARIYAASGATLALMWLILEMRRWFHGAEMATGPVGVFEASCYAIILLAFALAVGIVARARAGFDEERPFSADLMRAMRGVAWGALGLSALLLLILRHPWWGAQNGALSDTGETGLAVLMQAVAVAAALLLGRVLSLSRRTEATRFAAAAAAALFAWSFGHALIRWLHQAGRMDDGAPLLGLEGFAHSLWPLALVLVAAMITDRVPGRDTVRAYIHDLQAIWAAAVWPALGFAAFGLWLLFNPWWGVTPARIEGFIDASVALIAFSFAAMLSSLARRTPRLKWPIRFARVTSVVTVAHIFVALTLSVRWMHHRVVMDIAPMLDSEMWIYSAVWAVYGAGVFALGMRLNKSLLRWSGLIILLGDTFFVFFLTFTRLTGIAQFGSAIGLAIVLMGVAWFARTRRAGAPPPGELLTISPSNARRGKRYGRRQRSS